MIDRRSGNGKSNGSRSTDVAIIALIEIESQWTIALVAIEQQWRDDMDAVRKDLQNA